MTVSTATDSRVDSDTDIPSDGDVTLTIDSGRNEDAEITDDALPAVPMVQRTIRQIELIDEVTRTFGNHSFDVQFYKNNAYTCGDGIGKYTFIVINPVGGNRDSSAPLWVWLHGGGSGFFDEGGTYRAVNNQTFETWNQEESLSDLIDALTIRTLNNGAPEDNTFARRLQEGYRMVVVSMCDHDQYLGLGTPYVRNPNPNTQVNGLQATMSAIDYSVSNYTSTHVFAHGTSAGSVGVYALALSYAVEGKGLTGVVCDSILGTRGVTIQEFFAGTPGFPQQEGYDPNVFAEKAGWHRDPENASEPESRIAAGFARTPLLFVGGLDDSQCAGNFVPMPQALDDGFDNNCEWMAAPLLDLIEAQDNSPHQVAQIEGVGHVPTTNPGAANDVVNRFIDRVLSVNPSYPFGADNNSPNDRPDAE